MKTFLLSGWLVVLSCTTIFGAPCLPGNLQTLINSGASGCQIGTVQFSAFTMLPGETVGTPIDPAQVEVTPGGTAGNPMLLFLLNSTANAGEAFESFFRFSAAGSSLSNASIGLKSPKVTGDGAVTAMLDVCPNGSFTGNAPSGCTSSTASLVAFAIAQSSLLSDSGSFGASTSLDVFVDLRMTGGQSGSVTLDSATVEFSNATVPEPSAGLLVALGISALGVSLRARRKS
jgi:hypothetical protein